ncbi:MAG: ABC transporter substrate binding protein [Sideroxydans sp.]|nr:ABC transporter substrate binding protein [Sideroxydans sp.]
MVCALFAFALQAEAQSLRVTVVLSEAGGAYQEYASALQSNLSRHYPAQVVNAGEAIGDADLVIAVGMKAATALAATSQPVLNVLVPRAGYDRLPRASTHASMAIYMDQPMERRLALLTSVLPNAKDIGVLYATPPLELENLKILSAEKRFELHERVVNQQHPLASALNELLQESEVLFVLPDAAVYNSDTIRNILLETYRKQVPMVGISPAFVRAGALCAVYSSPQQVAQQSVEVVEQFALSGKLPASQYPREFEVSINTQVARSLGLTIKDAEQLRAEIRRKQ